MSLFSIPRCRNIVPMANRNFETSLNRPLKSFFKTSRRQILSSQCHSPIKTSLNRLCPSCFIGYPGLRKWVHMAFRHLETSLQRLHQPFFQDIQNTDYLFSGSFAYLKHHLCDFVNTAFFDAWDTGNDFAWHFDTLNIASSTSQKSYF
jgi:hypothetical protein